MPRTIVSPSHRTSSRRARNWEARTARAMVRLLAKRTTVLRHPSTTLSSLLASATSSGRGRPVDRIGGQQAAEEHDLGRQEQPHSERGRFALLIDVVELLRQDRLVVGRACEP